MRPETDRNVALSVRISPRAHEMLCEITRNKSKFIDGLIKDAYARWKIIEGK